MAIRGIILLAFFLGSLPVCFFRPFYGVLLWAVVAFLNPQSYIWGAAADFPWAVVVAVPTLAGYPLFCRRAGKLASRGFFLLVILWLWFTLTTLLSTHTPLFVHHYTETIYRWKFVSKVLLMTAMTIAIVDSFDRLRILVMVMAGCFGIFVLKDIPFIIRTGGNFRLYGPENSMVADNNDFGLALNMTLPLFFFLAQTESKRWVRWFCGLLFILTIPSIFFTYSRGALVGLIAVSILMFLQLKQRVLLIPVIILGVTVAMLFAPPAWRNRMDPTRSDAVDESAKERLNSWAFARHLAADYPIAGGGFGTFTPELFGRYAPEPNNFHGPHSVYFQLLAEHGYVGLLLYLSLILSCFAAAHNVVKHARFRGDRVIVNYANMFRFSMVGFVTSGTFLGRAYFDYFFSIVACLIILQRVAREEWAERDQALEAAVEEEHSELPVSLDRGGAFREC